MPHMTKLTLGNKLFLAPVEGNEPKTLDFDTGSRVWAIEMTDKYPEADIISTVLSATRP